MIELLKIHALVRSARVLVFVGTAVEEISLVRRRRAGRVVDEATAWCDKRDAGWRQSARKGYRSRS